MEKGDIKGCIDLTKVVEDTPYPVLLLSKDNRILSCNQALANLLGLARENIIGRRCFEVIHGLNNIPDFCPLKEGICLFSGCDKVSLCPSCSNCKERGKHSGLYVREFFEPKLNCFLRVTIFPLYSEGGDVWGYLHFIEDQTEKLRLFEEAVVALVVTTPYGEILRANRRARELFKVPESIPLHGLNSTQFWGNLEVRKAFLEKLLEEKEIFNFETVLKDFEGREFYALISSKLYECPEEITIYTAIQDITNYLKVKDQAIKFVKDILEFLPVGVAVIDENDRIIYANPKLCNITGYTKEELLGSHFHNLINPNKKLTKLDSYIFKDMSVRSKGDLFKTKIEVVARKKEGSTFPAEIVFEEFHINSQRFFVGAIQDITDRKLFEERLLREEKEFVIEKIAGGLAHDLNNLLMIVKGYLELLSERAKTYSEKDRLYVKKILDSFDRMKNLVSELFILSKVELQTAEIVNLGEFLKQWIPFFLQGTGIEIRFELEDNLIIPIKESHLISLIQNIVINAKEAMDGTGVISVKAYDKSSEIVIEIEDTGKGIPPHLMDKIFDPGFSTKPHGSGLGLFVVKRIMENYGGKVEIKSNIGLGTKVTLRFPKVTLSEGLFKQGTVQAEMEKSAYEKVKILILEDEEEIRNVLEEFLKNRGLFVTTVENGDVALFEFLKAMQEGNPYTHLLLDLTVPHGKGGVYFLKKLRDYGVDLAKLKVIIMTGFTEKEIQEQARDYKIDDILFKPFSLERVIEVL